MDDVVVDWSNTKPALKKLISLFNCALCGNLLKHPCSFDICNHYFCKQCALQLINESSKCPKCDAVLWREHMQTSLKIPEVLAICEKLQTLVANGKVLETVEQEDDENTEHIQGSHTYVFQSHDDSVEIVDHQQLRHNSEQLNDYEEHKEEEHINTTDDEMQLAVETKITERTVDISSTDVDLVTESKHMENMKNKMNCDDEADLHAPLLFRDDNATESSTKKFDFQDIASPPKSQFSNAVSDSELKMGVQQNPRRRLKKPKITYSKKCKQQSDDNVAVKKTLPSDNKELDPNEGFSIFEFSSGQCSKKYPAEEVLNKKNLVKLNKKRSRKTKLNPPDQRRYSKASATTATEAAEKDIVEGVQPYPLGGEKKTKKPIKKLEKRNMKGETPLHTACIKGNYERAKELLQLGAEPNTKDFAGWTPLHEACNHGRENIVELLLDHGAILDMVAGDDNDTPLHDAVSNKRINVVKLLLQRGAPTNIRNRVGLLPIEYAISSDMKNVFKEVEMLQLDTTNVCDVTHYDDRPKIILTTNLIATEKQQLKKYCENGNGKILADFDDTVTHVICAVDDHGLSKSRTMKYILGLLTGKWLVSYQWAKDSISSLKWLPEADYEVKGILDASDDIPRKSRINAYKKQPKLFDGCSFFISGSFDASISKETTVELIKYGGGKILMREPKTSNIDPLIAPPSPAMSKLNLLPKHYRRKVIYHAAENSSQACCTEYIIYDPKKSPGHKKVSSPVLCTAPVSWLLDCVSSFQILDVRDEYDTKVGFKASQT